LTKTRPTSIGKDVPSARRRRKAEVSPGNTVCATVENTKADRPKPDMTIPVADALYNSC
jgi:hypothetical protein